MRKSAIGLLALALAGTAQAAETGTLIDGTDVESVINVARDYGSATYGTQQSGAPKIIARTDGVNYVGFFQNCTTPRVCDDLNLYAGFLGIKPTLEQINAWNASKRFGRAYIDPDGDAAVEMDINLKNGVSPANLSASFAIWRLLLGQFVAYVEPLMPEPEPSPANEAAPADTMADPATADQGADAAAQEDASATGHGEQPAASSGH